MTIEEKAKAYDEALEKAKKYMDEGYTVLMPDLFPQLHESEDEQTRKRLIDFISNIKRISESGRNSWAVREDDVEMCNAFLAYLEKQKEQPKEELVYRLNGLMQEYIKEGKDEAEKEHRFKCYQLFWDALEDTSYFEQKEQKPAEKQDYSGLTDLERAIHRGFLSAGIENVPVTIIKETANECKRIVNKNANAEWNEDDESFYDSIMCEVIKEGMHPTPAQSNWFKSLPERFNFQSKQEWSEEDEILRVRTINRLETLNFHGISGKEIRESIAWLKSLRPQPHWKPSEQEKGALRTAIHVLTEERNFPKAAAHLQAILDAFDGKESRKDFKPSEEQKEPEYYQHFDPDC